MLNRYTIIGITATALLLGASAAGAATHFSAVLNGAQEVPSFATPATGTGTLILNDAETQVTVNVVYSGLLGTPVNSHIHEAPAGVNGPVRIGFPSPWTSPITGTYPITPAQVIALKAGNMYFNVHSSVRTSGEIRGQITQDPVPTESSTWSKIKSFYR